MKPDYQLELQEMYYAVIKEMGVCPALYIFRKMD
jgi:hypothetical protein